jgi:hypothetical protein
MFSDLHLVMLPPCYPDPVGSADSHSGSTLNG